MQTCQTRRKDKPHEQQRSQAAQRTRPAQDRREESMMADREEAPNGRPQKPLSPVLVRLLEEIQREKLPRPNAYNRTYNRHMRSV